MDLVYECFVKLGLRYICVLRDGKYAGMVSSTFSSSSPVASLPTYSTPLLPCETGGERGGARFFFFFDRLLLYVCMVFANGQQTHKKTFAKYMRELEEKEGHA